MTFHGALFDRLEAKASAACSFRLLAAYPVNPVDPVKKLFIFSAQPLTGLEME